MDFRTLTMNLFTSNDYFRVSSYGGFIQMGVDTEFRWNRWQKKTNLITCLQLASLIVSFV